MIQVIGTNVKSSCRLPERGPQRDYRLPIGARAGIHGGPRPEGPALEPEAGHGGSPPLIMCGVWRVACGVWRGDAASQVGHRSIEDVSLKRWA